MTATGHALIGTVIAAKVGNPVLAIPIALASHFIADALPHWDTGTNRKLKSKKTFFVESVIDVLVGFLLSWLLIVWVFPETNVSYAFLIIIMAQLPDWLTAPYLFFDLNFFPFSNIYHFQKKFDNKLDTPWGVINQTAAVLALIVFGRML
jgi:hypothetical protein